VGRVSIDEAEILRFVGSAVNSVWSLELLIRMRQQRDRIWRKDELVRELRASGQVIDQSLDNLKSIGFIADTEGGQFLYSSASPLLEALAEGAQRLYREKPVTVINAIAAPQNEKLRIFAEAFRLRDN
jgi:hypothetical protein